MVMFVNLPVPLPATPPTKARSLDDTAPLNALEIISLSVPPSYSPTSPPTQSALPFCDFSSFAETFAVAVTPLIVRSSPLPTRPPAKPPVSILIGIADDPCNISPLISPAKPPIYDVAFTATFWPSTFWIGIAPVERLPPSIFTPERVEFSILPETPPAKAVPLALKFAVSFGFVISTFERLEPVIYPATAPICVPLRFTLTISASITSLLSIYPARPPRRTSPMVSFERSRLFFTVSFPPKIFVPLCAKPTRPPIAISAVDSSFSMVNL